MTLTDEQAAIDLWLGDETAGAIADLIAEQEAFFKKRDRYFALPFLPVWPGTDGATRKARLDANWDVKPTPEAPRKRGTIWDVEPWVVFGKIVDPGTPTQGWDTMPTLDASTEFYSEGGVPTPIPVVASLSWKRMNTKYTWGLTDIPWRAYVTTQNGGRKLGWGWTLVIQLAWGSYTKVYERKIGFGHGGETVDWRLAADKDDRPV